LARCTGTSQGRISVLTSVNLLHVEGYKEKVQAITGKDTAKTIPKSFLLAADDIVIAGLNGHTRAPVPLLPALRTPSQKL
jgi:Osmosensitive K+ channel His kinase sensor domain